MKRSERAIKDYRKAACDAVENLGGQIMLGFEPYTHIVPTKAGVLLVSISDDCSVCTRFKDVEAAKTLNLGDRLNPFSGKWNWMGGFNHEGDMLDLAYFQQALRKIV